jgi:RNA-directed DNA polymerase
MQPVAAARTWDLPVIESAEVLADWLGLGPGELDWFADLKGLGQGSRAGHYHYRILAKGSGSVRLIEAPKARLKELQRRILRGILERIPSHPSAHGFLKKRSIQTFARPHVGRPVVLKMDLQDYFPSFRARRIQAFFRTAGYPELVADLLTGVCTTAAPRGIWRQGGVELERLRETQELYARPHLPQGAPTSPALANLCTDRVDCRLSGLAKAAGADYTRYADDLAFSGGEDFERSAERFSTHVAAVLMEEGFRVHHRKTRVMKQGVRQHVAGLVVNRRLNVRRDDFDRLKAVLTNCVRLGPESQNREGHIAFREHLEGRVAFVTSVHAPRGERLRAVFEQIRWEP